MAFLQLTAIIVDDCDNAIAFFTQALGFELAEDTPAAPTRVVPSAGWSFARRAERPASSSPAPPANTRSLRSAGVRVRTRRSGA
jgi:catechol 2,3-dioxygenase-like lactoylglutathione lyase family enzyme